MHRTEEVAENMKLGGLANVSETKFSRNNIFIFFLATRYQECIGEILHVRLRCASKLRCTAFCARGSSFRHFTLSVQLSHGETPLSCLWIAEPQNICPGSRHKRGGASHRHLPRTPPRLLVRELPATGPLPRAPGSRTSPAHEGPLRNLPRCWSHQNATG